MLCAQDLLAETGGNLENEGRNRMAALLNRMERDQVEQIITSLRRERPEDAEALKKMLFSFEDLPRIEQKHRLVLFDKVQTEQVMLALRGADAGLEGTGAVFAGRTRPPHDRGGTRERQPRSDQRTSSPHARPLPRWRSTSRPTATSSFATLR